MEYPVSKIRARTYRTQRTYGNNKFGNSNLRWSAIFEWLKFDKKIVIDVARYRSVGR